MWTHQVATGGLCKYGEASKGRLDKVDQPLTAYLRQSHPVVFIGGRSHTEVKLSSLPPNPLNDNDFELSVHDAQIPNPKRLWSHEVICHGMDCVLTGKGSTIEHSHLGERVSETQSALFEYELICCGKVCSLTPGKREVNTADREHSVKDWGNGRQGHTEGTDGTQASANYLQSANCSHSGLSFADCQKTCHFCLRLREAWGSVALHYCVHFRRDLRFL